MRPSCSTFIVCGGVVLEGSAVADERLPDGAAGPGVPASD
jgi:hypothetical protein